MKTFPLRLSAVLALSAALSPLSAQDAGGGEQAAREAAFQRMLEGSSLVGRFTLDGSDRAPAEESYQISKVRKQRDSNWLIETSIAYGGKTPVRVPVVVQVEWAGDTPMIQVTDLFIPGMGTFTARVGIYRGQYFGMWAGGERGGHMFGRVVRDDGSGSEASGERGEDGGDALWANWRGPKRSGEAPGATPPLTWSEDENVRWKTPLPGLGHSTPVVWGDTMFLTVAVETDRTSGAAEQPAGDEAGSGGEGRRGRGRDRRGRGRFSRAAPTNVYEFVVMAVDRRDGKVRWRTPVREEVPHESGHQTASQASNSPVTDGKRVYAHFGSRGIHCLGMDGELLWSKDFGKMQTRNQFGEGSSPALHGDTLVVNWDHEADSFIVALDKETGEEKWRQARDEPTSWSTPVVMEAGGDPQVVVAATNRTRAYDLDTGELVWSLAGMTTNTIPTPIPSGDTVYLTSGYRGSMLQAVRVTGAKGELGDGESVLWEHVGSTPYTPSPALYDGILYMLRGNTGRLSAVEAESGKMLYEAQSLPDTRTVYASPLAADGRVYVCARGGVTNVVRAGAEFEVLATNVLDDEFDASPIAIGKDLYLRGHRALYCISAR